MSQHKIENKKLKIDILGTVYDIRKPKFKEIVEMQEKIELLTAKDKLIFIGESLVNYGIPRDVVDELDGASVLELLEILNGTKKN